MASDSNCSDNTSNLYFKEVQSEPRVVTQYDKSVWRNIICLETGCSSTFETKKALMEHLIELHEFSFELEESEVANWQEFQVWKDLTEENEKYNYALFSRKYDKISNRTVSLTFSCQGSSIIRGDGGNHEPIQHACTSLIEAKEINESLITIEWIRSHYGHVCNDWNTEIKVERDLDTPDDKQIEVSQTDIATDVKDEKIVTTNCRIDTPMELSNDDSIFSLDLWVHDCEGHQDNPVLFYKPPNCKVEGFSANDFCLIVMTSFQADMLLKYPDIVAIDSTYGLEDCEFELTTLLVIDKKGELFPVAFMLTNNENKSTSTLFFGYVKEKVGNVCPQIFISEMTGKFYDSWCGVMGPITNWLFCSCHLEHIWKLNLLNIKSRDKRIWVYETLKELQLASDEKKFVGSLDSALNEILNDQDTFAFGEAFQNSYVDCIRQWVYCYRKELGLEADIFLDNMKKMVRYPGSKGKIKKRDEIVCDMLKYVRDKTVTCIAEEAEGDLKQEIDQNHDRSVQNTFEFLKCSDMIWKLRKEGEENIYSVEKLSNTKCCDVTCCECDICVHTYLCSCPAYFINSNICEHIHYVALNCLNSRNQSEEEMKVVVEMELDDCSEGLETGKLISKIMTKTLAKLQNVDFDSIPENVSSQILAHLVAVSDLMNLVDNVNNDSSSIVAIENEPS